MTIGARLKNLLGRLTVVSPAAPTAPAAAAQAETPPREQWADQASSWGGPRRLYANLPDARVAYLRSRFPGQVERTRQSADRICRHEFNLLGSGWLVPADPARRRGADGYQPLDWAVDPIAGLRFPTGFPHKEWNPQMRPGLADIKWPWEIGRCQHWVTLGQAFRLTGDERYALEILRQHADFMQINPVGIGVQYVCTMDVAIRALNWALAFDLIRASASFDSRARDEVYRSLFDTGVFIEGHLENKYEVTSNHFLSNVVGLYGLGVVFADVPAGKRWLGEGRAWLEQEMRVQVLEDGADYESSIPYHRLVAELFLGGARLADLEGQPLSDAYLARLRQMIDFHVAVMRPDGLMPQVGDADDGRLHIFSNYGTWAPQDGRHLAGAAALVLREPAWLGATDEDGLWEAAWWGANIDGVAPTTPAVSIGRLFEHAGLAVVRQDGAYLLVTNGRVGTNGFGNHKHNDLLGFEFHARGVPLIVDPGSYVYTSNPDARNLFRSTAYHNTVQIDGTEQNDLRRDYLFRMFETSAVEHLGFEVTETYAQYRGRHTGYERLSSPVTHERTLRLARASGALALSDVFRGSGVHEMKWHFHVAPGVHVTQAQPGVFALSTPRRRWHLRAPTALTAAISDAWYSPSYGVRVPCQALDFTLKVDVTGNPSFAFAIESAPHA